MSVNAFIEKLIIKMSHPIPRLRDPMEQLHIQIEMQDFDVNLIVSFLLMKKPEYKYNWGFVKAGTHFDDASVKEYIQQLLVQMKIFNTEEVEWVDDAVHEILVE